MALRGLTCALGMLLASLLSANAQGSVAMSQADRVPPVTGGAPDPVLVHRPTPKQPSSAISQAG